MHWRTELPIFSIVSSGKQFFLLLRYVCVSDDFTVPGITAELSTESSFFHELYSTCLI
jgi:hypothetical protein